ncbi:MAG: hypothetical protein R8G01_20645 [Ilumatobacteraceae bacterium]|nr:hypothetical protein [Ilumatobacteraceae bacterium]
MRVRIGIAVAAALAPIAAFPTMPSADAGRFGSEPVEATVGADAFTAGSVCLTDLEPETLNRLFDTEPGGVVGADYQRALALPDGRVFWTFQDAAIRLGPDEITIVHNIAVIQTDRCFDVRYRGSRAAPRPMFFADRTVPYARWFWPLDASVGDDGRVYVYAAEMEERGEAYLTTTVAVGTWVAIYDPVLDAVVDELRPPDSSADLYGWSTTSDDRWTYLYAQCYRQFGFDEYAMVAAFDRSCSPEITVARVPVGKLFEPYEYWDGAAWVGDPTRAVPIIETRGRRINADQIEWTGSRFVSVNKEGDWWGDTILLSESASATGPFRVYDEIRAPIKCGECNSFFASWVPAAASRRTDGSFVISLGHNRWDGVVSAFYRPTFHRVMAPTHAPARSTFELTLPVGTGAAALNVAAVGAAAPGFLTVYPCDAGRPVASNVNHVDEPVVSNLVLTRPDASGRICIYTLASTDLVVDMAGGLGGAAFRPRDRPERVVDTRIGTGAPAERIGAGEVLRFELPTSAATAALALNVIAIEPTAPGFLTAYRCDRERPETSNVNYVSEPVVSNLVVLPTGGGATATTEVCIFSLAETDIVVDLSGSFTTGGYVPLDDALRLLDTRDPGHDRLPATGTIAVDVGSGSRAAVLNVIAAEPSEPGFITVYACDEPVPTASNINFVGVPFVSNLVVARPSVDGRVCITSSAETDVVVDLAGALGSGYEPLRVPERLVDTRIGTGVPGQLGRG